MAGQKRTIQEETEQGSSASAPRRGRGQPRQSGCSLDAAPVTTATSSTSTAMRVVKVAAAWRASIQDHAKGEGGGDASECSSDSDADGAEDAENTEDMDNAVDQAFIDTVESMDVDLPPHILRIKLDMDDDIERLNAPSTAFT